ncbi:hypothetical protein [Sphingomonas sp.]|jgi:hypothetical protein|uniref:hypothetical protein n=1 Tax=Sphingomonas sp. TaxID=28214 RepID=UPI002E2F0026|nr:hypothetical protein [Sphingomonas sp.]HEX4693579.1 hypothetical protein [Sphingomonas sp.]
MSDARLVWQVWRTILTSDALIDRIVDPARAGPGAERGMSRAARTIVAEYARTPLATATNIDMYRQGLARNALGALSLVPLSRHVLFMSDLDIDAVAQGFAASVGYADYGPRFWQAAGAFVEYLATLPIFASPACHDVAALDLASVALARRLGAATPPHWPADAATAPVAPGALAPVMLSPAAVLVRTRHDLSAWIQHPDAFDPGEAPPAAPSQWLVYLPTAEAARAYVQLSPFAADIAARLATPGSATELASLLGEPVARVVTVIASLSAAGLVVEPLAKPATASGRRAVAAAMGAAA